MTREYTEIDRLDYPGYFEPPKYCIRCFAPAPSEDSPDLCANCERILDEAILEDIERREINGEKDDR